MADATPDVRLVIGSLAYGGWTSIEVVRTIEAVAGSFTFGVTERWPGRQDLAAVKPGQACRVTVDGETVITGFVDDVDVEYDKETHGVTIKGRDATGDLVDSSVIIPHGLIYQDRNLLQIAQAVAAPYGIKVSADVDISKPFTQVKVQVGESPFELLERLARLRAVLLTSDGQGGLKFTRAGSAGSHSGLILGRNLLRGHATHSYKDRFDTYIVFGQDTGSDLIDVEIAAGGHRGEAHDPTVARFRPKIVIAEVGSNDQADYVARARWEASVRAGRARRATLAVQGWRDGAGALWRPNRMVKVDDGFAILGEELLISGVKLTVSGDGTTAELTVTRREAFDLAPLGPLADFTAAGIGR